MFEVCGIIEISKIEFFNFSGTESVKPNRICANNNPTFQNFFQKSEAASKRKVLSLVMNSFILDLEFLELPLLNYIATKFH